MILHAACVHTGTVTARFIGSLTGLFLALLDSPKMMGAFGVRDCESRAGSNNAVSVQKNFLIYLLVWKIACIFHQKPNIRPMTVSKGMALPSNMEDS